MRLKQRQAFPQKDRLGDGPLQNRTFHVWVVMGPAPPLPHMDGLPREAVTSGLWLRDRLSQGQGLWMTVYIQVLHHVTNPFLQSDAGPASQTYLGLPSEDTDDLSRSSWKAGCHPPLALGPALLPHALSLSLLFPEDQGGGWCPS